MLDLEKAKELFSGQAEKYVSNINFKPFFLSDGNFYYVEEFFYVKEKYYKYIYVESKSGNKRELFDHKMLAIKLSHIAEVSINPYKLPISIVSYQNTILTFKFNKKIYIFDNNELIDHGNALPDNYLVSPDNKKAAFVKDYDLYVVDLETNNENRMTYDGEKYYAYASSYDGDLCSITRRINNIQVKCIAKWSNDSRFLLTHKIDERNVKELSLLQNVVDSTDQRPIVHTYKYAFALDDDIPMVEYYILDTINYSTVKCNIPLCPIDLMMTTDVIAGPTTWDYKDNLAIIYCLSRDRKNAKTYVVVADTGKSTLIKEERSETFIFTSFHKSSMIIDSSISVVANQIVNCYKKYNIFFYMSEEDGYYHIYRYNLKNGELINKVTNGNFVVRQFLAFIPTVNKVYFTASDLNEDNNPYYTYLYSVNADGTNLQCITKENANHKIFILPNAEYFIDYYSTATNEPVICLKNISGEIISHITECEINGLYEVGYKIPIPLKLKAKDNKTDIYGIMVLPPDFDANKRYPIVEYHYGGAHMQVVPHDFAAAIRARVQSIAACGFISIIIDGRGTILRDKKFHDFSYNNLKCSAGLIDHIAAYEQLSNQYPFLDTDRVGIVGFSGGGYGSLVALTNYSEIYKCAFSISGNHFNELYSSIWSEQFMGLCEEELLKEQSVLNDIDKMTGKLFIVHGDMDDNVHPANTIKIIDQLIKKDKNFEMLIIPNAHHGNTFTPYIETKILKFFINNL